MKQILIVVFSLLLSSCAIQNLNFSDKDWKRHIVWEFKLYSALGIAPKLYQDEGFEEGVRLVYLKYQGERPYISVYKSSDDKYFIKAVQLFDSESHYEDCIFDENNHAPENCEMPSLKHDFKKELTEKEWLNIVEKVEETVHQQENKSEEDLLVGVDGWGFQLDIETGQYEESYYEWAPSEGAMYDLSLYLLELGKVEFN